MSTSFLAAITRKMFPNARVDIHLRDNFNVYVVSAEFEQRDVVRWTPEQTVTALRHCFQPHVKDRKRHTSRFWARRVRGKAL